MVTMRGKFNLIRLEAVKSGYARHDPATGRYEHETAAAVRIELQAVTADGTATEDSMFARSTPSGRVELTVTNPILATALTRLWTEYVTDPGASQPQFYADFTPALVPA